MKWAELHYYYTNIYSMTKNKNNKIDIIRVFKYINQHKNKVLNTFILANYGAY